MGRFVETFTQAYSGTAVEKECSLNRGDKWNVLKVTCYFAGAAQTSFFEVFRKDSASAAGEQDPSDATSIPVLRGKQYLSHGITMEIVDGYDNRAPRVYMDLGDRTGTAYITVDYEYQ